MSPTRAFPPDPATPPARRAIRKGRGAPSNDAGRFEPHRYGAEDDGWGGFEQPLEPLPTTVSVDTARTIISRNESPDIPFDRSINPYRGCEHGCIYCYARPTHAYLGLSAGVDFETRLYAKQDAPALLHAELRAPGYTPRPIALGTNTDPYQPIERRYRITRGLLEVLADCAHPVTIVTKSARVERDLDLLASMAAKNLVQVYVSVTTLDHELARRLEPRATAPARRIEAISALHRAGVPVGVMVAPVIPILTDAELESILEAAHAAGATSAGYVLLRLPYEVKDLFKQWLAAHAPLKAEHVMARVRDIRGGKDNDAHFGTRMQGQGTYAELIRNRYQLACRRLGLAIRTRVSLNTSLFRPPPESGDQLDLL
jgi:DNA repair photolyase